jgi:nitrile hydratase alpha subunit
MATTQAVSRHEIETQLIEKCWKDPEFKRQVVSDPKGMLERHIGQKLPEQVKIFIHEEDASTLHLSIPPAPSNLSELSDDDLEKVAGGTDIAFFVSLSVSIAGSAAATVGSALKGSGVW